eukprot:1585477-Lingulodinium_polyedra.AAC.1
MAWHSEYYPGRLALLLSTNPADVTAFLARLKEDYQVYQECVGQKQGSSFLQAAVRASPFETTFTKELAHFLCPSDGHPDQATIQAAKACAQAVYSGFGQSK